MGYTHFYQFKVEKINKSKFALGVALFKLCVNKLPSDLLFNGIGEGKAVINNSQIVFNGNAELDLDGESFGIDNKDTTWNFCKTFRQPYGVAVCLCLLCMKKVFGEEFWYDSDGITRENIANPSQYMIDYAKKNNYVYEVDKDWAQAYEIFDKVVAESPIKI